MAESHRDEIAKLQSMYDANPEGRVFTHLAEAYRKAGELAHAREILEDGLRRHADSASGFVVLGRVMQDLDQPQEAAAAFARVLELDPENRVALRALGDLARTGGRDDQALAYYQQILTLDPTDEAVEALASELRPRATAAAEPAAPVAAPPEFGASAGYLPAEPEPSAPEPFMAQAPVEETQTPPPFPPLDVSGLSDVTLGGADAQEEGAAEAPVDLSFPGLSAEPEAAPPEAAAPELPTLESSWPTGGEEAPAWPSLASEDGSAEPDGPEAGAVPEFPLLDATAETFPQPQPAWGLEGEAESVEAPQSAEMLTETMADLYRSQGHMERAAEVYRALLKERPGDEQLERKLLEVELAILAPGTPIAEAAPPAPEQAEEPLPAAAEGAAETAPAELRLEAGEFVLPPPEPATLAAGLDGLVAEESGLLSPESATPEALAEAPQEPVAEAPPEPVAEAASGAEALQAVEPETYPGAEAAAAEPAQPSPWEEAVAAPAEEPAQPEPVAALEPEPSPALEPEPVAELQPEPVAELEPEPGPVAEPAPEPAPVAELEPVASLEPEPQAAAPVEAGATMEAVWSNSGDVAAGEPTPYVWEGTPAEEETGAPVAEYLRSLAGWRLSAPPPWAVPAPRPEPDAEPAPAYLEPAPPPEAAPPISEILPGYQPPGAFDLPAYDAPAPVEPAPPAYEPRPYDGSQVYSEQPPVYPPVTDYAAPQDYGFVQDYAGGQELAGGEDYGAGQDYALGNGYPGQEEAPPAESAPETPAAPGGYEAQEPWGQAAPPPAPTWADEAAAEPWTPEEALAPESGATEDLDWLVGPGGLAPENPPAAAAPEQGGAAPDEPGEDDDLEMFRAWLQSLKK